MGQTIHWDLYLPASSDPGSLLEDLRTHLGTQSFGYVGQVIHRSAPGTDFSPLPDTDPDCYPMILARRLFFLGPHPSQPSVHRLQEYLPLQAYALLTVPASGCEPAVFGFARYPATIADHLTGEALKTGCGEGWWGHAFCTTRGERPAHDRVLKALDFLATHKAVAAINDEAHGHPQVLDSEHARVISG
jgi:hypothetical protein